MVAECAAFNFTVELDKKRWNAPGTPGNFKRVDSLSSRLCLADLLVRLLRWSFSVPAMRAYWKGYLKLSFVSCPITLYPATSASERLSFRQINRRTGHRVKHKLVDSVTGEAVDTANKARGYEVGENQFLLVDDRDIEQARIERPPPGAVELSSPPRRESPPIIPAGPEQDKEDIAPEDDDDHFPEEAVPIPRPQMTRTIEIVRVLPTGQIDARYFEKPYYIVPREEVGQESFAVIRDAMTREGVVGLARSCCPRASGRCWLSQWVAVFAA